MNGKLPKNRGRSGISEFRNTNQIPPFRGKNQKKKKMEEMVCNMAVRASGNEKGISPPRPRELKIRKTTSVLSLQKQELTFSRISCGSFTGRPKSQGGTGRVHQGVISKKGKQLGRRGTEMKGRKKI